MRRGIILAIFCELCLALSLNSTSVFADSTKDFDDEKIEKLSSQDAAGAPSGYAPWKDMARSLKDSDFDDVLAIHWVSGHTTFSNAFKHSHGKPDVGASGDGENMLLVSEIIDCVPSHKGCKREALFTPVKPSSDAPSTDADEGSSDSTPDNPATETDAVSANTTLATPESGSSFLLALGILGLSPMLFRRKRA
jgi:hypothetical protein